MGFWVFMLFIDLICPFTMIGFGSMFRNRAPQNINSVFGYRTRMSSMNRDTWEFAHKYFGRILYFEGLATLVPSVLVMLLMCGKSNDAIEAAGVTVEAIQLVLLLYPIIPTEIALRKNFDKNGRRKEPI